MSSNTPLRNSPSWNYGKNASFGLWATALNDNRVFLAIYKGFIFERKTTVLWKANSSGGTGATGATVDDGVSGGTASGSISLEFSQKIEPTLLTLGACGGIIPASDFPVVLFVSNSTGKAASDSKPTAGDAGSTGGTGGTGASNDVSVLYTKDDLKTFKKLQPISDNDFYSLTTGDVGSSFKLPEPDKDVYGKDKKFIEETKKGLLIPLWRVDVEKTSDGAHIISEILDIRTHDTFAFAPKESDDEDTPQEPCEQGTPGEPADGGGNGYDGAPTTGGAGDSEEPGEGDEEDTDEPCLENTADDEVDYLA